MNIPSAVINAGSFRNPERSELQSRSQPDLLLCLALIHHVVIGANIPLVEFIDWLAGWVDRQAGD